MDAPGTGAGLGASLRRALSSLLEMGQARLELLATEVELEKLKIFDALLKATIGLLFLGVALLLFAAMVLLMLQESYRLGALATMTLLAAAAGAGLVYLARRGLRAGTPLFDASAAELERDRAALMPHEPPN